MPTSHGTASGRNACMSARSSRNTAGSDRRPTPSPTLHQRMAAHGRCERSWLFNSNCRFCIRVSYPARPGANEKRTTDNGQLNNHTSLPLIGFQLPVVGFALASVGCRFCIDWRTNTKAPGDRSPGAFRSSQEPTRSCTATAGRTPEPCCQWARATSQPRPEP